MKWNRPAVDLQYRRKTGSERDQGFVIPAKRSAIEIQSAMATENLDSCFRGNGLFLSTKTQRVDPTKRQLLRQKSFPYPVLDHSARPRSRANLKVQGTFSH